MRKSLSVIFLVLIFFFSFGEVISPTSAEVEIFNFENLDSLTYQKRAQNNKKYLVTVTGYSSSFDETDNTPFITASGVYVYDGAVASNFLKLGTKIKIPSLFGDKIFVVEDTMNQRFKDKRIDIWFPSKLEALNFGIHKNIEIEIIEEVR